MPDRDEALHGLPVSAARRARRLVDYMPGLQVEREATPPLRTQRPPLQRYPMHSSSELQTLPSG